MIQSVVHDNISRNHGIALYGKGKYGALVMPYYNGGTLRTFCADGIDVTTCQEWVAVEKKWARSHSRALSFTWQLLEGLEALRRHEIVHLDLKPDVREHCCVYCLFFVCVCVCVFVQESILTAVFA